MVYLSIAIHTDELEDLIDFYEHCGHFNESVSLLEAALELKRAYIAMFTELAIFSTPNTNLQMDR